MTVGAQRSRIGSGDDRVPGELGGGAAVGCGEVGRSSFVVDLARRSRASADVQIDNRMLPFAQIGVGGPAMCISPRTLRVGADTLGRVFDRTAAAARASRSNRRLASALRTSGRKHLDRDDVPEPLVVTLSTTPITPWPMRSNTT